jgi:hypothetical protein
MQSASSISSRPGSEEDGRSSWASLRSSLPTPTDGIGSVAFPPPPSDDGGDGDGPSIAGEAVFIDDDEVVSLLQRKPKEVPQLRSRGSFRRFFTAVPRKRMRRLLVRAFAALGPAECDAKVAKRMGLLEDVLSDE